MNSCLWNLQCGQSGGLTLSQAAAAAAPMSIHWPCKAAARQGQGSGTNLNDRQFNRTSHTQSKRKQLIDHQDMLRLSTESKRVQRCRSMRHLPLHPVLASWRTQEPSSVPGNLCHMLTQQAGSCKPYPLALPTCSASSAACRPHRVSWRVACAHLEAHSQRWLRDSHGCLLGTRPVPKGACFAG